METSDVSVRIILPVRNRREVTLRCLAHLRDTGVLAWAGVIVVDDGSTDGTAEAIHGEFSGVEVLTGDGDLFWTGAIEMGMRRAMAQGAACCVWLNDDCLPTPGAVERLVEHAVTHTCITSAVTRTLGEHGPVDAFCYRKTSWRMVPFALSGPDGWITVDACRGNLVAIPRPIIAAIGYPDSSGLPHYYGDADYTLRARAAGFRCLTDPTAFAEETVRAGTGGSWLVGPTPLREIWARFARKQGATYWRANWVYFRRHWGFSKALVLFADPYLRLALISLARLLLPARWLGRMRRR